MSEKDYDAAAEWAEHEMAPTRDSKTRLRGQAAAAFGQELIEHSQGGRPSIDPDAAPGEKSPVRQVRLPRALNADLDAFAKNHHRNASDVVREALSEYLAAHKDAS